MAVAASPWEKTGSPSQFQNGPAAPTLAKPQGSKKILCGNPLARALCLAVRPFAAFAACAASTKTALGFHKAARLSRCFIVGLTRSTLLFSRGQKCFFLSTLQYLCVLSNIWEKLRIGGMGHPSAFVEITLGWVLDHSALFEKRGILFAIPSRCLGHQVSVRARLFSVSPTRAKEHGKVLPSTHKRLLSSVP